MRIQLRILLGVVVAFAASSAQATFHTFRIDEVFSNADGVVQYVVLREAAGFSGQQFLGGLTFTSTHAGSTKTFVFPSNLPSGSTGGRKALIATQGFAALNLVTPDYVVPNGFIATDGGTLNYAGVDQITYGPLPTDGVTAITRTGAPVPNAPGNFAGASASVPALPVTAVEFYRAATDHYFISALQPDIDALDTGHFPGWARTGQGFRVFASAGGGAGVNPVCRIYIPPPGDSHFFSASPAECDGTRAKFPTFVFEAPDVFYIALPDQTNGACPAGTIAVYRVFDNRVDPNHRYTTDRATRDAMVAKGYIAEGYGADAVIMCAPPSAPSTPIPAGSPGMPGDPGMQGDPGYPGYPG